MHISVLTLFPDHFTGPFDSSIIQRARKQNIIQIHLHNLREYALDAYKSVDDHPYGGGVGMILRVDTIDRALSAIKNMHPDNKTCTILLDPAGDRFTQQTAMNLAAYEHLIFVCGHYEGVDERVKLLVDSVLSIGDYVLTGGELPAMVMIDAVTRLLPGVLIHPESVIQESFSEADLLEYPQYTRPQTYKGMDVPPVLLSGNHAQITAYKNEQALQKTKARRPDLLTAKKGLSSTVR